MYERRCGGAAVGAASALRVERGVGRVFALISGSVYTGNYISKQAYRREPIVVGPLQSRGGTDKASLARSLSALAAEGDAATRRLAPRLRWRAAHSVRAAVAGPPPERRGQPPGWPTQGLPAWLCRLRRKGAHRDAASLSIGSLSIGIGVTDGGTAHSVNQEVRTPECWRQHAEKEDRRAAKG